MDQNSNNFMRWTGVNTPKPFTISAGSLSVDFFANVDSVVCNPLSVCAASNGINTYSLIIIQVVNGISFDAVTLEQELEWNGVDQLEIFRPINLTGADFFYIEYYFSDVMGNNSAAGVVIVTMSPIVTTWIAYSPSAYCTLDAFGNNTGFLAWLQLVLVNSATSTPVAPLTLKPNVISDADYLAPITDYVTCPSAALPYSPLYISNFSQNGADTSTNNTITIFQVYLYSATLGIGGTPIALNIPTNVIPGGTQRLNVPAGTWDSISISYTVNAGGNMDTCVPLRYWKANVAGVVTGFGPSGSGLADNPVDNSGILAMSGGITIPTASSGITVFAQ